MKEKSASMLNRPGITLLIRSFIASFLLRVRTTSILCILVFVSQGLIAQNKRLAAIGSSTTAGYGTTTIDSCWFSRCSRYYKCQVQVMDSSFNFGVPGVDVYAGMPTSFVPPAGRPSPDSDNNISKAVSVLSRLSNRDDGVIIVNYPTNEYNTFNMAEIMNCLQSIYDSATSAGFRCFITTTQPRADAAFNNSATKKKLADIKDSILIRFGEAHTINFWDGMFNTADTTILPIYSAGDNIHFNNAGHRVLFQRVVAKNVFRLPVWYASASGFLNVLTTWGTNTDGSGTHPTSFAADNQLFVVANNLSPTINGNWMISGKNVQLMIGDGIKPVVLNIPKAYTISLFSPPPGTCE